MHPDIDLLSTQDLLALPPRVWLMQDVIPKEGFCGLVGPPASGKSFVALDWAMCIAEGRPWFGHATTQAPVVYIAAEGGRGIQSRVRSWMTHYGHTDLPAMYWLLEPLYVREDGAVENFLAELEADDIWPGLVVVDTLSRSFGGGEENASADMGLFVERMTELARGRRMAALVVHHMNAQGSRERGHTSFKGGLDTMFVCKAERQGGHISRITLTNEKQKDSAETEPIYMAPVEVGESLILGPADPPAPKERGQNLPAPMRKIDMLTLLGTHADGLTFTEWRLACGIPRTTFSKRVSQLVKDGEIYKENNRYSRIASVTDLAELGRDDE